MKRIEWVKTLALWLMAAYFIVNAITPVMAAKKTPTQAQQIAALQKQVTTLNNQIAGLQKANLILGQEVLITQSNRIGTLEKQVGTKSINRDYLYSLWDKTADLEKQVGSKSLHRSGLTNLWDKSADLESRVKSLESKNSYYRY